MKKVLFSLALAFLTLSSAVFAQSPKEEVDLMQSVFGMKKKALVAEFIQLEEQQATTFWNLYDEYETKRKALGEHRLALLVTYSESYDSMDDAAVADLLNEMMGLQRGTDKLITIYTKKIKKAVNVKTAAQFYQIEGYILSKIRTRVLENIPLLGSM